MISDLDLFSPNEGQQKAANGLDWWGVFRDAQVFGRQDAGLCASLTRSRLPQP